MRRRRGGGGHRETVNSVWVAELGAAYCFPGTRCLRVRYRPVHRTCRVVRATGGSGLVRHEGQRTSGEARRSKEMKRGFLQGWRWVWGDVGRMF